MLTQLWSIILQNEKCPPQYTQLEFNVAHEQIYLKMLEKVTTSRLLVNTIMSLIESDIIN